MTFKISSWNVEGRLTYYAKGERGTPERIIDAITMLDADVIVLLEAYIGEPAGDVDDRFRALGYTWYDVPYGTDDRDWSKEFMGKMPSFRVASRLPIVRHEKMQWGGRELLIVWVADPETKQEVRIVATHLDDRSEERRMKQVDSVMADLAGSATPTIMLGDFNAMWKRGRARLYGSRSMRYVARHLPGAVLRDVAVRFTDMATGSVLAKLAEKAQLRDVDMCYRATTTPKMRGGLEWLPSIRLAQIDHILVSPQIRADNFTVSPDGGSDHRAISAVIRLEP